MTLAKNRKMVPCYLKTEEYLMLNKMAEDEMRSLSGFIKVLIYSEGEERDLNPDMFKEEAEKIEKERSK